MTGPGTSPGSTTPLAVGGMSPQGQTTVVTITRPKLDYGDKKVLCSAVCQCQAQPTIGVDGQSLKQICVSNQLKALDETLLNRSLYKPEVTYDMSKNPPVPFMDHEVPTKPRALWPGWTKTLWPKDPTRPQPYKPGRGYTRRPDVVIVKDPTKPPTQDNIKQVVEMKFPGDEYSAGQREDYVTIAGGESKMVPLKLEDCSCSEAEPQKAKVPVDKLGAAAALLGLLYMIVMKRPPPRGVPSF